MGPTMQMTLQIHTDDAKDRPKHRVFAMLEKYMDKRETKMKHADSLLQEKAGEQLSFC